MNSGANQGPIKGYVDMFERTIANYVVGEVCFVVAVDRLVAAADLYEIVRNGLNRDLTDFLHPKPAPGDTPARMLALARLPTRASDVFASDLTVADLTDWSVRVQMLARDQRGSNTDGSLTHPDSATSIEILRPLIRMGANVDPWVVLPRGAGPTTLVVFFGLNSSVDASDPWLVRQLVNCANLHVVARPTPAATMGGYRVIAATPNWLTIANPAHGCGSPAGPPEALPSKQAPLEPGPLFTFGSAALGSAFGRAVDGPTSPPGDVVVAILDTSPPKGAVQVAATPPDVRANWLMREVNDTVHFDGALSLDPGYFAFLSQSHACVLPNLQGPEVEASGPPLNPDAFSMVDHGLFASGIVRHLAPAAEIHVIRVLGNEGVGDLHAIISTLSQLPGWLQTGPKRRLVVNLSLGADIPVGERLLARWFPNTYADPATLKRHWADVSQITQRLDLPLAQTIASLDEQGVLVVAAVGNDAFTLPTGRKDPRYPAHYANVLGVTATTRSGRLADYANHGEEAAFDDENGIATFGGNARLPEGPGSGPPRIDTTADPVDAAIGIFCAEKLPTLSGAPLDNLNGWVYWSGTSFATPIVSAVAANLWQQQPGADHHQIIKDVLALTVAPAGPVADGFPDVPFLPVAPV